MYIHSDKKLFPHFPKTQQLLSLHHWSEHLLPRLLMGITIVSLIILVLPWQQSVSGMGEITTLQPHNRPQYINAPISGKVKNWLVVEGQIVQQGQILGYLEETQTKFLDPQLLERFESIQQTLEQQNNSLNLQKSALTQQTQNLQQLLGAVQQGNTAKVANKKSDAQIYNQKIIELDKQLEITLKNLERMKQLHEQGLRSTRDLEIAENEAVKQRATLQSAKLSLQGAYSAVSVVNFDGQKQVTEGQMKQQENLEKIAKINQEIAKNEAELFKMKSEISSLKNRSEQKKIIAPMTGMINKIEVNNDFVIKEGEHLILMTPQSNDRMVSLQVSGEDINLIHIGDPVRLQFLGWPSIQISGFPLANFGTFSGEVYNVSPSSNNGKFQVLVKQNHANDWPSSSQLLIGNQVKGLVLLKNVLVIYELWRRMNGFPAIQQNDDKDNMKQKSSKKEDSSDKKEM